ncbi:unnamed protein product [Dovyalis caffra]|uniref:Uncharacterized protein n=1 Tax=Dovyalis caffra TaxID=77055 RepID=A0AAV1RL23_9ROSI|nr:unnamed protein product [Dovyalis caffra]
MMEGWVEDKKVMGAWCFCDEDVVAKLVEGELRLEKAGAESRDGFFLLIDIVGVRKRDDDSIL